MIFILFYFFANHLNFILSGVLALKCNLSVYFSDMLVFVGSMFIYLSKKL